MTITTSDLENPTQEVSTRTASVTLFRKSGKYYTIEAWRVPAGAIGPEDMHRSPDFRRIDGGIVLVDADAASEFPGAENWGFPHLFPAEGK
jgi:hypothetical protein